MRPKEQINLAIIGDSALDLFIEESPSRFTRYNPTMTIDQILEYNRKTDGEEPRGSVYKRLGGPVLTVGQYLAGRDLTSQSSTPFKVSAVTILGTDPFSERYKDALQTLQIELDEERTSQGTIARCAYIYAHGNVTKPIIIWEDGVNKHFKDIKINKHFLARQDILVLPITEPSVGKRAAEDYRSLKPEGTIVYNPGPYLQDSRYDFESSGFKDIIAQTNMLVLNRPERIILKERMNLRSILQLFSNYLNLDVLISTKDKDGSIIFSRDPIDKHAILHSRQKPTIERESLIENPTGAGDAFLGTFLRYHLGRGYDVKDAHVKAKQNAERQLTQKGATDQSIVTKGEIPSFDEDYGRLLIAK